jgi:hypothetical protein
MVMVMKFKIDIVMAIRLKVLSAVTMMISGSYGDNHEDERFLCW